MQDMVLAVALIHTLPYTTCSRALLDFQIAPTRPALRRLVALTKQRKIYLDCYVWIRTVPEIG